VLANREEGMDSARAGGPHASFAPLRSVGDRADTAHIPYIKFGGLKFLEAAHVKDVIAILRWAENPKDEVAALRVLKLVPGIGPGAARARSAACRAHGISSHSPNSCHHARQARRSLRWVRS